MSESLKNLSDQELLDKLSELGKATDEHNSKNKQILDIAEIIKGLLKERGKLDEAVEKTIAEIESLL